MLQRITSIVCVKVRHSVSTQVDFFQCYFLLVDTFVPLLDQDETLHIITGCTSPCSNVYRHIAYCISFKCYIENKNWKKVFLSAVMLVCKSVVYLYFYLFIVLCL